MNILKHLLQLLMQYMGSTFFMATGFHGLHVLIGTTFLAVCLIRHLQNHFSKNHHFGFEAAA